MEGFLPEFSQTYLKKTPKKVTSEKNLFMSFWAPFFSNQSMLGTIFAHIFRELVKVFRDFARIFTKSELWGGTCTPCTPVSYTSERNSMTSSTFYFLKIADNF